jgi:hypothetical protein
MIDEEVIAPSKLENLLTWGDAPIPHPIDEVVYLELLEYNK